MSFDDGFVDEMVECVKDEHKQFFRRYAEKQIAIFDAKGNFPSWLIFWRWF